MITPFAICSRRKWTGFVVAGIQHSKWFGLDNVYLKRNVSYSVGVLPKLGALWVGTYVVSIVRVSRSDLISREAYESDKPKVLARIIDKRVESYLYRLGFAMYLGPGHDQNPLCGDMMAT